jgi:glutathione S-transferase
MSGLDSQYLRLHGYPVSNYFNIAHAVLLEKQAKFEVVPARAQPDVAFLGRSPMGKIPFLETPQGCIAETIAIIEYVEETLEGPSLLPKDAFARARVRQVINIVQVYIEVPLRSLFPGVFFGLANEPATVASVAATLDRAMAALSRLVTLDPFLLGARLTLADLFAFHCFDVAERVTRFVYGRSLLNEVPGLRQWQAHVAARESSRIVLANFAPAFAAYLKEKNAAYRESADA